MKMATPWKKEIINAPPSAVPSTRVPSSAHAIRFGPLLFVTGQSGRRMTEPEYVDDPVRQARQCLDNICEILKHAGTSYDNVLKRNIIVRDRAEYAVIRPVVDEYFVSPVASSIIESGLLRDEHKILEIEVIACIPEQREGFEEIGDGLLAVSDADS
jgi:2-iminobutanoate/2-iminopropanoate deaminase